MYTDDQPYILTNHVFVEKRTNKEHSDTSHVPVVSHRNQGDVKVPQSPSMHGHVPGSPKSVDVIGIPPVKVEAAIGELQKFADQIQKRMERYIEHAQPSQMIWYLKNLK